MPKIDIDMFEDSPKVGDKVKVMGEIESIDEDTGEVEVSYDDVSIVDKSKKKKKRSRDQKDDFMDRVVVEDEVTPQSQSLDSAMAAYPFSNTQ